MEPEEVPYKDWYPAYIPGQEELLKQRHHSFSYAPLISIVVPVYKTPVTFLKQMISSVKDQTYENWELLLLDAGSGEKELTDILKEESRRDRRIRVKFLEQNLGISENTNEGFALAKGEFTGLLDHDDLLAPNALFEIVKALQTHRLADLIYTDEDKLDSRTGEHFQPHLKPDFNLDLLRSNNYICHFLLVRTGLIRKTGGLRSEFNGAQDYDFVFRCTEASREVLHVPEILYHWRTHSLSTADNPASKMYAYDAGKRAIEEHLARTGTGGTVTHEPDYGFYRVHYPVQKNAKVSIIIPNKDEKDTLKNCIDSIFEKTTYSNFEILIIENNSSSKEIFQYYRELSAHPKIRLLRYKKPFNYSEINNYGAKHAHGDYLLFLNNDTIVITPDWIEQMLGICQRREVGAVGVKLLYPDQTIQHAGCVIGMGGIAGALFVDMPASRSGYLHKASLLQDLSAVTAACMMVKKPVFYEAGGFTEKLSVAFNDMDLCLKIRTLNKLIVYDPYTVLYHVESKTRGAEDNKEKVRRFQSEIEYFRSNWTSVLKNGDPYYNKNLSLKKWNYSLKPLPGMKIRES